MIPLETEIQEMMKKHGLAIIEMAGMKLSTGLLKMGVNRDLENPGKYRVFFATQYHGPIPLFGQLLDTYAGKRTVFFHHIHLFELRGVSGQDLQSEIQRLALISFAAHWFLLGIDIPSWFLDMRSENL